MDRTLDEFVKKTDGFTIRKNRPHKFLFELFPINLTGELALGDSFGVRGR